MKVIEEDDDYPQVKTLMKGLHDGVITFINDYKDDVKVIWRAKELY
jgi:hypothetical protein